MQHALTILLLTLLSLTLSLTNQQKSQSDEMMHDIIVNNHIIVVILIRVQCFYSFDLAGILNKLVEF